MNKPLLTQEEIKLLWLAELYKDYPANIFNFQFNRPVRDYTPVVASEIVRTDGTQVAAFGNYLTVYNHVEKLSYVIPLVHNIGISTVKMLLNTMINEDNN